MLKWLSWLFGLAVVVVLVGVVATYESMPTHNTDATHFDTIIVLGWPTAPDGKASKIQTARVMEAVREFGAGRAGHVIVTGGAAHNGYVEAQTMAKVATDAGVPAEDVIVEGRARNTIENIYYSNLIMEQHGWRSAEVVSSASHLPRTGLILERYKFGWRTHAAPNPRELPEWRNWLYYAREMSATAVVKWFGFAPTPFLPGGARGTGIR